MANLLDPLTPRGILLVKCFNARRTPPQKPSDERIGKIAKTKHLDPATGLPPIGCGSTCSTLP
ncbi:DUF6396 domain-containing protein [Burkholderia seminalis]|uniref:DUF6396 domain-containing protein n=1 Tax=Burkholderia seminalis TaxID=488731 RepID=UPI0009F6E9EA|nr:DUF6396 domain-containing protein [Burkholderia seminalis]MCA8429270.1 DUF6396 domain-containing protein [Burkholderia seminalis]RQS90752.1 hypothetical protein DF048_21660 [Burkholderia seminalis]